MFHRRERERVGRLRYALLFLSALLLATVGIAPSSAVPGSGGDDAAIAVGISAADEQEYIEELNMAFARMYAEDKSWSEIKQELEAVGAVGVPDVDPTAGGVGVMSSNQNITLYKPTSYLDTSRNRYYEAYSRGGPEV